jgi:hypothetical protein
MLEKKKRIFRGAKLHATPLYEASVNHNSNSNNNNNNNNTNRKIQRDIMCTAERLKRVAN